MFHPLQKIDQFQSLKEKYSLRDYYYLFGRRRESTTSKFNWEIIGLVKPEQQELLIITTTYRDGQPQITANSMSPDKVRHIQLLEDSTPEWFDYIETRVSTFHSWHLYEQLQENVKNKNTRYKQNKV